MPPKPFFKKQPTTIAAAAVVRVRSLSRFGDINVRTNERGTHNKYEFLYCPPAAAAAAACVALAENRARDQGVRVWDKIRYLMRLWVAVLMGF